MEKSIIILLTIAAICCETWAGQSALIKILNESKIIPNVVSGNVSEILKITFDSGISVDMGNEVSPNYAKNISAVDWNADSDSYYTIICTDPDAPSPGQPFLGEVLMWLVGNIPGKAVASGNVLAPYFAAAPPKGAKLNRVIFSLYKQPNKLTFQEKPVRENNLNERVKFSTRKFAEKYGLILKAINFYRTKYSPYVLEIYKKFNCCFEYNSPSYKFT